MEHSHSHHDHSHVATLTNVNSAFVTSIILNSLFVLIEAVIGFSIHSLSLLSDAGHNLADVGSLGLALLAFRLLKVKSNNKFTYGYRKTTILAALFNAMVLLISIGAIAIEAIERISNPPALPGKTIAIVAAIGIVINFATAILFLKNKEKDLNIKSAYMHMMADALVSAGIMVGGIIISYTHLYWIDPALSIVIVIVILIGTWSLLKDSLRLSLDGVPKDIKIGDIKNEAEKIEGIRDLHHIHVWAMSTTENAMTAHLVIDPNKDREQISTIKNNLKHKLQHMNIQHITLETEYSNELCKKTDC
jgi:cobalt-zinc-cadmium efflux system protein